MSTAHDLKLVADPPLAPAAQGSATVGALLGHEYALTTEPGTPPIIAARATSCLLEPALGDRVWFVSEPGPLAQRRGYVVAVLEREPSEQPARLSVAGRLTIHASEGLELRSDKQVILQGDEVQVRGRLGRVLLDECSTVLRSLFTHATKATFVGEVIETLAERISTHSKTTHRTVDGVDQLEAGTIHYRASESAQIGAEHTLITGGEIVKVEGSQIHLG